MKKYCLTLDLKNDERLIAEYEAYHRQIWPEIKQSITKSGITKMEIYRYATRLFMVIETVDNFSFDKKAQMDKDNPKVQEWEMLMWRFQQPLKHGEKWVLLDKIFDL